MAVKSTCECVQLYGVLKETEVIVCLRFAVVLFCCSLRTSETNYLNESYAFYSAIRMRGYYSKANKEERFVFLLHLECLLVCNDRSHRYTLVLLLPSCLCYKCRKILWTEVCKWRELSKDI